MKAKIYMGGANVPVAKAIRLMTDDWIDCGNSCPATIMSLRDALKKSLKRNREITSALKSLVARCDGADGVRGDGSNIDTSRAHNALTKI